LHSAGQLEIEIDADSFNSIWANHPPNARQHGCRRRGCCGAPGIVGVGAAHILEEAVQVGKLCEERALRGRADGLWTFFRRLVGASANGESGKCSAAKNGEAVVKLHVPVPSMRWSSKSEGE
jgi:hypothetical protein